MAITVRARRCSRAVMVAEAGGAGRAENGAATAARQGHARAAAATAIARAVIAVAVVVASVPAERRAAGTAERAQRKISTPSRTVLSMP